MKLVLQHILTVNDQRLSGVGAVKIGPCTHSLTLTHSLVADFFDADILARIACMGLFEQKIQSYLPDCAHRPPHRVRP